MRSARILAIGLAFAGIAAAPHARACTISATGVAFGAYNPRSAAADDGTGTIDLACASSVRRPEVALGTGSSGTYSSRSMANGATKLNYNLYTNNARTNVWGNGSSGTSTVTFTGGSNSGGVRRFTRTIYGRIPALQNVRAGNYGDTLIVTVTF